MDLPLNRLSLNGWRRPNAFVSCAKLKGQQQSSLRLTGGAYAVYQQLGDEPKHILYTAFGIDPFVAWQQIISRQFHPTDFVDVYLANLRKLSVPFGGVNDKILSCAFLVGLPEDISKL